MAIDIRATVTCSLGTLISGSISDDYVQGTGLIKTRGSVELSGIATPAIGTVVTFSYTKGGVTRSIPRKLRVLSSFADPFRRTTKVELGCKLTYLSDLQEPIKWTGADDPQNSSLTDADAEIITRPIYASSVAGKCLAELGITASGSLGLTNSFSIPEFDFGAGYVQVLSDLLVSECKCGYLNTSEQLVVFSLSQSGGTGPVLDASKIIDLGPIGVGQLPGEAVVVSYSTLKLRNATEEEPAGSTVTDPKDTEGYGGWDRSATSSVINVPVQYSTAGGSATRTYRVLKQSETLTYYGPRQVNGQLENLVTKRVTTNTTSSVDIAGGAVAEYLSNGLEFPDVTVTEEVTERFSYDSQGNEQFREQETYHTRAYIACGANVPFVFSATDYVSLDFTTRQLISRIKTYTTTAKNRQLVRTETYLPWSKTINGQQTIAQGRDSFTNASQVQSYLSSLYNQGLALASVETSIQTTSRPQAAPSEEDKINATNADKPDADVAVDGQQADDYRTESQAELELALGSSTAQRRIELSLPYAPDDRFVRAGIAPNYKYWAIKSSAAIKAANYGRAQNALLLGNRSGMNVQTAPELVPEAPYAPVVVQANGLSALYRMNGTSWQMDANGVLLSSDLLFWGAVGGTGAFWFPVAPGVTSLPSTPPVVAGEVTVSATVPVWNETVLSTARTRTKLEVTSLPYALTALTALPLTTKTKLLPMKPLDCATGSFTLTGQAASAVKGSLIGAESATFTLTPCDATSQIYPYRLVGGSAVYTLTGGPSLYLGVQTGTATPELGSGGATSYEGWTRVLNGSQDEGFINLLGWPFNVTLDSVSYDGIYLCSNAYLTFGTGQSLYSGLGATVPAYPKIHFGAGDRSYQRVYTYAGVAADGTPIRKVRYEGHDSYTGGVLGSPTIVAEFTFFAPRANGEQWIELRVGNHNGTSGPFMIANATTAYATSTITAGSSWVFVGNSTGTSWTLTSNRYID